MEVILTVGVVILVLVLMVAGTWATYEKAGKPGWASIVPIYNLVVLLEITGKPIWWLILFFLPLISLAATILIQIDLARAFRKNALFGLGLTFLPFIFYPILGFGNAQYGTQRRERSDDSW